MRCLIAALILLPATARADAPALSARIDDLLAKAHARDGVRPAPPAGDAEFFRRLCLDLIGRIPTVAELKDFLDDDRPDKRMRWIDEMLEGPDHAELSAAHLASTWRRMLLARATGDPGLLAAKLESWLRRQFEANTPYDRLVRELFASPDATAFYRAHENKPENLAGSTARLFLGIKLECAQCHDDRAGGPWKRKQFWETAAFFSGLQFPAVRANTLVVAPTPEKKPAPARIQIPDTETWVDGRFLDGTQPSVRSDVVGPFVLADWITRPDNPWFARTAVNRIWHGLFGVGLIDPVDGLGHDVAPSQPEVLDELTRQFVARGFDMKFLIRAIAGSQTYQRTSQLTHPSQQEARHFARATVRGLSPEQVYASFLTATGFRPVTSTRPERGISLRGPPTAQELFLARFNTVHEQPIEAQTSIQQALFLMNDTLLEDATSLKESRILAAVANAGPSRSTAQRVEDLYLAVLSRPPRPEEVARLVRYVEAGKPASDPKQALRDVLWALLNSTEFPFNH